MQIQHSWLTQHFIYQLSCRLLDINSEDPVPVHRKQSSPNILMAGKF